MTTFTSPAFRTVLLGYLALYASALGCSTSSAASGDEACVALTACCTGMNATAAAACIAIASTKVEATCTSTLMTYQQSSLCGGGIGPVEAGHPVDSGLPCELTHTCTTTTNDGGTKDTGVSGACQSLGSCSDGETYKECTTVSGSACIASFIFSGGTTFTCASCSDCASAQASAQSMCGTTTMPMDAGVDAGNACGTTPVLHPETAAGVYCPFTATGSIHCTAGQECCEAPSTSPNSSTCQTVGATCPIASSLSWACNGPLDCASGAAGPVCCAAGTVTLDSTCDYNRGTGFTGSHCATSCVSGELSICSAVTDPCNSGTCTPFKTSGIVLGTCQ